MHDSVKLAYGMGCLEQLRASNVDPQEFIKTASNEMVDAINHALASLKEPPPKIKEAAIPSEETPGGAASSGAAATVIGELLGDSANRGATAITDKPTDPEPTIMDRLGLSD